MAAEDVEEAAVIKALEDAISEKEAVAAADPVVTAALEIAANSEVAATGEVAAAAATEAAAAVVAAAAPLVEPGKPTNTHKTSGTDSFCPIQSSRATKRDLLVLVHCARDILNVMCFTF